MYKEMLKKYSSQELLHQMGQFLGQIIPRTRRLNFVQMKSLGSCMAPRQGLKLLRSDIDALGNT